MRTLTFTIIALLLGGCGGSDSNSGGTRTPFNPDPFLGTWAGTYQERGGARRSGTLQITLQKGYSTVEYAGGTGKLVDSARGEGNAAVGLTDEGRLDVSYGFGPLSGMYSYAGTPRIDERGHLVAALEYDYEGKTLVNGIDLAPVTP